MRDPLTLADGTNRFSEMSLRIYHSTPVSINYIDACVRNIMELIEYTVSRVPCG